MSNLLAAVQRAAHELRLVGKSSAAFDLEKSYSEATNPPTSDGDGHAHTFCPHCNPCRHGTAINERDALRGAMVGLASLYGTGPGGGSFTSLEDMVERIKEGVDGIVRVEAQRARSEGNTNWPSVLYVNCERHKSIATSGTLTASTVVPVCPHCVRENEIKVDVPARVGGQDLHLHPASNCRACGKPLSGECVMVDGVPALHEACAVSPTAVLGPAISPQPGGTSNV